MYKHDPTIVKAIQELTKRKHAEALNPGRRDMPHDTSLGTPQAAKAFLRGCAKRMGTPARPGPRRERRKDLRAEADRTSATDGSKVPVARTAPGLPPPRRSRVRSRVQVRRLRRRLEVATSLEGQATAKGPIARGMGRDDGKNGRGSRRSGS